MVVNPQHWKVPFSVVSDMLLVAKDPASAELIDPLISNSGLVMSRFFGACADSSSVERVVSAMRSVTLANQNSVSQSGESPTSATPSSAV